MFTAALGFYFLLKQSAVLSANTRSRYMGRLANKFQDHQTSRTGQVEHGVKLITHLTVRPPSVGGFSVLAFCVWATRTMRMGIVGNPAIYMACVSAYMPFFFFFFLFFFFFFFEGNTRNYHRLNSAILLSSSVRTSCTSVDVNAFHVCLISVSRLSSAGHFMRCTCSDSAPPRCPTLVLCPAA